VLDGRPEAIDYARYAAVQFTDDEMSLFDEVLQHVIADGSLDYFADAFLKEMDQRKQRGFYFDLDAEYRVNASPTTVTKEMTEQQLGCVTKTLESLKIALNRIRTEAK
jgi:hypothetical protein